MLYFAIAIFIAGISIGGGGVWEWKAGAEARREAALAKAQAQVDALATKANTLAATRDADMLAAYTKGTEKAKVVYRNIESKGAAYVAANPALSNPVCRIGPDGLRILNAAITGTDLPSDFAGTDAGMRSTAGDPAGRSGRGNLGSNANPANNTTSQGGANVLTQTGAVVSGSQGQGSYTGGVRPKPVPIK